MSLTMLTYLLAGIIFGIWFLVYALPRRDVNARGAGWVFRVAVFPCSVLLWPVLLILYRSGAGNSQEVPGWLRADGKARLRHARIWTMLPWLMAMVFVVALLFRKAS